MSLKYFDLGNVKKTQISILGCGWLGLPLAQSLIKNGYHVKGSTTSKNKKLELQNKGIEPFLIHLSEELVEGNIEGFLKKSELLIINIPPGLRKNPKKNHVSEIEQFVHHIEKSEVKRVLYISSTSVFKDDVDYPIITHNTLPNATSNSAKQLIQIENLLRINSSFTSTILRFSGLIGNDRHPGKILSGRKNISNGKAPVNLVHRDDCLSIITRLIEKHIWDEDFNASYPSHPIKEDYYTKYCEKNNLEIPKFDNKATSKGKIIDSSKLAQLLKYEYKTTL